MATRALELLDNMSFGLALSAGIGPSPTVTIELERKQADELMFKISQEIEPMMTACFRPVPVITLGAVFQYRGVNYRIVERAKP